jgi:hypothetical protein
MKTARAISFVAATIAIWMPAAAYALPPSAADIAQPHLPADLTAGKRGEMPLEFFNYLKDCFVVNVQDGKQQYAAWLPLQTFLRMYAAGGGDSAQLESKVTELKPYLMFMVENRTMDQYKNPISETAESIRSRARLRLPDGTEVKPMDRTPEGMPANAPSFGTLGRRGQLLIFAAGENGGDLDTEDTPKGKLQLILTATPSLNESTFTWHLPLELSGTAKDCSKCHNKFSAKWTYCPWCGTKGKK